MLRYAGSESDWARRRAAGLSERVRSGFGTPRPPSLSAKLAALPLFLPLSLSLSLSLLLLLLRLLQLLLLLS